MASSSAKTSLINVRNELSLVKHSWSSNNTKFKQSIRPYTALVKPSNMIVCSTSVSSSKTRRPQNVSGEFFVDHTCIDCDTCRWMAPGIFSRIDGQSAVYKQPRTESERLAALQALLSCPTASIRTEKPAKDILEVHATFPIPVDEQSIPGVYHCGYHSKKSFAGASYFIKRPGCNILIDSPRFSKRLADRFEELGGIDFIFLTHKDDVADHCLWHERFKCPRILHEEEVTPDTADVEIKLKGSGPWDLLGPGIDLLFTPGHTEGHVCVFLKPHKVLLSGDHISKSKVTENLHLDPKYNWYSVPLQLDSIKALLPLDFVWILPGHGRRIKYNSVEAKNEAIHELLARMHSKGY